jgi:N-acetylmuramoyl-L-alanine amidase
MINLNCLEVKHFLFLFLIVILSSCSGGSEVTRSEFEPGILYETPADFADASSRADVIEKFDKYLSGRKFFIDPGHGGGDRKNSGFDSLVEADLNLNVGLALRDYLESAGAEVFMSRSADETVDLKYRSIMAEESGAEYFISIHHNAPGSNENYWTDYTSTYYHSLPGNYDYEPFDHDMARYVQRDLAYVMRNSGGLGSFDGTYSDFRIYPGDGFSVLRETQIPAILIECAFFTNRFEKYRLTDRKFNKIQAWGIFRGLGKFFMSGFPQIKLLKEKCMLNGDSMHLELSLEDSSGIVASTIETYFDSVKVEHKFNSSDNILTLDLSSVQSGEHELRVICENKKGKHSEPYLSKIITQ